MLKKIIAFARREAVFTAAFVAAAISAVFVPPSADYAEYFNMRVLFILFSLMTVVSGFQTCQVFTAGAEFLCRKMKNFRSTALALTVSCFFLSMFITNDVALITFVPFTLIIIKKLKAYRQAAFLTVLETIAANLGSMLTPLGNPQNLFLYTQMDISAIGFIRILLPYTAFSLLVLVLLTFFIPKTQIDFDGTNHSNPANSTEESDKPHKHKANKKEKIFACTILFCLCLLCVFRLIPAHFLAFIIFVAVFATDRQILLKVDYMLLLTFCAFFIFTGNIGKIESIKTFLQTIVKGNEFISGILASQVISNVPAALLLEPFCESHEKLLLGVNIGGLGTLVASLASLISYKIYKNPENSELTQKCGKNYMAVFTFLNILCLALLCILYILLNILKVSGIFGAV